MDKFINCPKIFYINMEKSKERNDYMIKQFEDLNINNYERFDALCEDNSKLDIIDKPRNKTPEEYYCLLSHIKLIQHIYNSGIEEAIICEDDVDFSLSKYWRFSLRNYFNKIIDREIILLCNPSQKFINDKPVSYNKDIHFFAMSYYINRKGCEKIINNLNYRLINNKYYLDLRNENNIEADIYLYSLARCYVLPLVKSRDNNNSYLHPEHLKYHKQYDKYTYDFWTKKKLLIIAPFDISTTKGGAEYYLHFLLQYIPKEFKTTLLILNGDNKIIKTDTFNIYYDKFKNYKNYVICNDIIISQLHISSEILSYSLLLNKKCIFINHGFYLDCDFNYLCSNENITKIYNNPYLLDECLEKFETEPKGESLFLMPTIKIKDKQYMKNTFNNEYITYVNLDYSKGAEIFYKIVESMPEKQFLAVKSWGNQIIREYPNLKIIEKTDNIYEDVYKKTRLFISPTFLESFGMCIAECCKSGVPVIVNNLNTLHYTIGDDAEFINDNHNINEWVDTINKYDDIIYYHKMKSYYKNHIEKMEIIQKQQYYKFINFMKNLL